MYAIDKRDAGVKAVESDLSRLAVVDTGVLIRLLGGRIEGPTVINEVLL